MNRSTLKKVDMATTKFEKKTRQLKRKSHKKVRFLLILVGFFGSLALFYSVFFQIYNWSRKHEIIKQYPVIIRSPIIIREVKENPIPKKPTARELAQYRQKVIDADRSKMIERIYQYTRFLESEFGFNGTFESTHRYCQTLGKVNEIGYFPEGNRQFCFESEEEQRSTFTKWLNKYLDRGYTMSEALCTYVNGVREPMCKRSLEIGI